MLRCVFGRASWECCLPWWFGWAFDISSAAEVEELTLKRGAGDDLLITTCSPLVLRCVVRHVGAPLVVGVCVRVSIVGQGVGQQAAHGYVWCLSTGRCWPGTVCCWCCYRSVGLVPVWWFPASRRWRALPG